MKKNKKLKPPPPPLSRVINEGGFGIGHCPICHSSTQRKPILFGKRYCLNPRCKNNYVNINLKKWKKIKKTEEKRFSR
jgi:hypothetical protein